MIYGLRGWQDTGKTAIGVSIVRELLLFHGYVPDELIANTWFNIPGAHIGNNKQVRQYMLSMILKKEKHKIIFLDEADRVFPARFWQDKEQTMALLGLWQDEKCFHHVIYTAHNGTAVDITLRNTTQIEIEPYGYNRLTDTIPYTVYNAVDGLVFDEEISGLKELIFPLYDRWKVID